MKQFVEKLQAVHALQLVNYAAAIRPRMPRFWKEFSRAIFAGRDAI
jgi:hypothetical protein